jgi:RNA polymerase sigma-70 factor (ECF subfamily)
VGDPYQHDADRRSRETFVRETYGELYRWFHRLCGSPDLAADLTQDTFTAFWASAESAPATVSGRTWLYAIGRNHWRNQLRARKAIVPTVISLLPGTDPIPESTVLEREFREAVELAIAQLPEELSEAFTLRFWQGLDYKDIGIIQGVSAGLARWRYFAARRRLCDRLAAWDPNPGRAREERHAR